LDQNVAAFSKFSVFLISSCMQFWYVTVIPKYLNFATFSYDLLAISMFWFVRILFTRRQRMLSFVSIYF
jgi:hypothetical protein